MMTEFAQWAFQRAAKAEVKRYKPSYLLRLNEPSPDWTGQGRLALSLSLCALVLSMPLASVARAQEIAVNSEPIASGSNGSIDGSTKSLAEAALPLSEADWIARLAESPKDQLVDGITRSPLNAPGTPLPPSTPQKTAIAHQGRLKSQLQTSQLLLLQSPQPSEPAAELSESARSRPLAQIADARQAPVADRRFIDLTADAPSGQTASSPRRGLGRSFQVAQAYPPGYAPNSGIPSSAPSYPQPWANPYGQYQPNPYQPNPYQPNPYQPNPYQPNPYQLNQYQPSQYQPNPYQPNQYQPSQYQPNPYQSNPYQPSQYPPGQFGQYPVQYAPGQYAPSQYPGQYPAQYAPAQGQFVPSPYGQYAPSQYAPGQYAPAPGRYGVGYGPMPYSAPSIDDFNQPRYGQPSYGQPNYGQPNYGQPNGNLTAPLPVPATPPPIPAPGNDPRGQELQAPIVPQPYPGQYPGAQYPGQYPGQQASPIPGAYPPQYPGSPAPIAAPIAAPRSAQGPIQPPNRRTLLRTTAQGQPSLQVQGVYVTQGSESTSRGRLSINYPITPNLLFGGAFDVAAGQAFAGDDRPSGFKVNELYLATSLKEVPNLRFLVGQMDLTSYFDRNSFAKDGATHFFNPIFQTNPALSTVGLGSRPGLMLNWTMTDSIEAKAAAFSSARNTGDFALDGFAGELGLRYGNAIIRGTYATGRDAGAKDGFQEIFDVKRDDGTTGIRKGDREEGYGVNAEVYIPSLRMGLFGRYGRYENRDLGVGGDTVSGGLSFLDLFAPNDRLGLAYGVNLSNGSVRRDVGRKTPDALELFYDFRVLPNLRLGFTLQSRDNFSETIAGFRLKTDFDAIPIGKLTGR